MIDKFQVLFTKEDLPQHGKKINRSQDHTDCSKDTNECTESNRIHRVSCKSSKNLKKQKEQIGMDLRELSDKYSEHKKIDSNMYM